jgi:undecaprenyl-diphosphatase
LNGSLRGHRFLGEEMADFVTVWAVPLFATATLCLWFLDRPGARYRWKTASLSALTAAGLGLVAGQVFSHLWVRDRPFIAHPGETLLLVPPSHEPSFPSDHAIAAFAIAFAIAMIGGRIVGAFFLSGATMIALSRVFVGLHYPGDVLGGAAIGLGAAAVVAWSASTRLDSLIRVLSKISDPLVTPVWRRIDAVRARRRADETSG